MEWYRLLASRSVVCSTLAAVLGLVSLLSGVAESAKGGMYKWNWFAEHEAARARVIYVAVLDADPDTFLETVVTKGLEDRSHMSDSPSFPPGSISMPTFPRVDVLADAADATVRHVRYLSSRNAAPTQIRYAIRKSLPTPDFVKKTEFGIPATYEGLRQLSLSSRLPGEVLGLHRLSVELDLMDGVARVIHPEIDRGLHGKWYWPDDRSAFATFELTVGSYCFWYDLILYDLGEHGALVVALPDILYGSVQAPDYADKLDVQRNRYYPSYVRVAGYAYLPDDAAPRSLPALYAYRKGDKEFRLTAAMPSDIPELASALSRSFLLEERTVTWSGFGRGLGRGYSGYLFGYEPDEYLRYERQDTISEGGEVLNLNEWPYLPDVTVQPFSVPRLLKGIPLSEVNEKDLRWTDAALFILSFKLNDGRYFLVLIPNDYREPEKVLHRDDPS